MEGKKEETYIASIQNVCSSAPFSALYVFGKLFLRDPDDGVDSTAVAGQLNNVQQIQDRVFAFAAILADGSTKRSPEYGGES